MTKAMPVEEMRCPGCGGPFNEVWGEANYGRVLLLDQCRDCGGVWFDRWELYFLKDSSLKSLEAVDMKHLLSESPASKKGSDACPKCAAPLSDFTDPFLPADATMKRCAGCKGLWLNRGELGRYAAHRAALKGKGPQTPGGDIETLRRLQKELDTSSISMPGTLELAGLDAPPIEPKEFAKDVGFLILQSLLRLVFKF